MTNHDYIISGGQEGKSRLNVLSGLLHESTKALLERNGLNAGDAFLDLGCGGGNVSAMVSGIVGAGGSVTAIDFDEKIIELARADAQNAALGNIKFLSGSAYYLDYDSMFDIAYARFLLSHLDRPLDVLAKMKRSVKPGGRIVVEDIQFSGHFCYPACRAFDTYLQYYVQAAKYNGADANIGPSLPSLFQQAGISDIGFDVIQPSFNSGPGKWMGFFTLDKIKSALIEKGIATGQDVDKVLSELEVFTKDEQTIISLPRIFRVWGTKI